MTVLISLIVIFVCLCLSAFFSGTEIAFNASNKMRLHNAAEAGSKSAALVERIWKKFNRALSAILIGNNLTNIAASSAATLLFMSLFGAHNDGLTSAVSTVVMTVIILIFGEIVPKTVCKKNADAVVRFVAYPIRILIIVLFPIVWLVSLLTAAFRKLWGQDRSEDEPTVTEEDLSTIIETVEEEGVIDEDMSELLQSTLDFKDTTVAEILTPRIDLIAVDIDDPFSVIEETTEESRYSRIPVYEDSIDNIIGILYLNRFYKAKLDEDEFDVRSILLEAQFIHKSMKLPAALELMQKTRAHMAVVVDEFGGTLGIVTMEDILEELVGDIWDESDEIVEEFKSVGENTYEISGDMNIEDFFDEIEFVDRDFESDYTTVGGWCVEMLEADPGVGKGFDYKNLTLTVMEMDDMRVTKVRAYVEPVPEEDEDE